MLYLEDKPKGLPPDAVDKVRAMLTFLQDMQDPEKLRAFALWRAHQLAGDRKRNLEPARYAQLASDVSD